MLANWSTAFPNCEPVGYQLRKAFPHRWVRFHSLPDSKRYPESEREYHLLLDRQNAIVGSLTEPGAPLFLLTTGASFSLEPSGRPLDWPGNKWWRTVKMEESFWHIYAATVAWEPHQFDPLLRRVAIDEIPNLMICHPKCHWLIHPYDGGIDVLLDSTIARDRLKAQFKDWLSPHASGL